MKSICLHNILTNARVVPASGFGVVVDKVELAAERVRLLPAAGQRYLIDNVLETGGSRGRCGRVQLVFEYERTAGAVSAVAAIDNIRRSSSSSDRVERCLIVTSRCRCSQVVVLGERVEACRVAGRGRRGTRLGRA